ncbi:hypothetical protein DOY81_004084 [Sarcophaga bullata]|nr:hypothetical protein DOY81_004084 [Sarcophaga bullata]
MDVVVKVEKLDDDDFENITMEEAQLSETVLSLDPSLMLENGLKKSLSVVEEDVTSILSNNIKSNLSLSQAKQPTPTEKPIITNYAESSTTLKSNKLIYSSPFYKVMQELGPNKDFFIVRCCNCGRLMRSSSTHTSYILEHMKKYHPDVAELYKKYKSEKFGKTKNVKEDAKSKTSNSGLVPPNSVSSPVVDENLKKLEDLISERIQKLVTDTGFKELNNKVNDLFKIKIKNDTESIDMIKKLQKEVRNLESECKSLQSTISKSEASRAVLEKQLEILENRLLQRKIIIKNIKISNREQPLQEVEKYFRERLNLYNISVIGCNVLPRSKTLSSNTETLLVELSKAEDTRLVVSQMAKLKRDDKVFIEHALSPLERKCREKLRMVRKELLSRNPDLNVEIRKEFLLIKKKKFYWDERYGLCHDILQTIDNYEFTCADHVEDLTGIDLKEFLNILHKYDRFLTNKLTKLITLRLVFLFTYQSLVTRQILLKKTAEIPITMESVVKLEKLDDEEFQSISIEDTQLSEVVLPHDPCLVSANGVKSMVSEIDDEDTLSACSFSLSEADQSTLTVKPSGTNDTASANCVKSMVSEMEEDTLSACSFPQSEADQSTLTVKPSSRRIYSPPFYKIVQQLGQNRDNYIVRCYTCGRLMKSKEKPTSNILDHMRRYHPEISKLYEKHNLSRYRNAMTPAASHTLQDSKRNLDIEGKDNISEENTVIEIDDDDDDDAAEDNTDNSESVHQDSISSPSVEGTSVGISATSLKKLEVIINEKLQNLVTETGFKQLNDEVNELVKINSIKDTENAAIVKELKSEIESLKKEYNALRLAVTESQATKKQLQNELQKLENRLQQRKLIIRNIKITNMEQPIKDVEKLFKENLNLHTVSILSCTIIPCSKTSSTSSTSDTETISVELSKAADCKLVLKHMHKLKNSKVFIEPELSPLQRKRKNKLMIIRRELLNRKPDLKVLVRDATLVVKSKNFYWNDTDGLCHDDCSSPEALQITGVEYLKNLTGLDLEEFLNILQKYDVK